MGWFSPIKGHYPSLSQIDKTLPVKSGVTGIERGTIMVIESDSDSKEGVFDVAEATDTKLLYIALQDYADPTAGFAGTSKIVRGSDGHVSSTTTTPAITGISLDMEGEYETSVYDTNATYAVGDGLKVGSNGKLTKAESSDTPVAYVTMAPAARWVNNAVAAGASGTSTDPRLATRTGAKLNVIRFRTK